MYKEAIEPVVTHFTTERYVPEFTKAKEIYFQRTGKVFEDEPFFEVRMTSFLEWYLFDRILTDVGVPPIRLFYMIHRDTMEEEQKQRIEKLQTTRHSLFETLSNSSNRMRVRDVWTNEVIDVPQKGVYAAVQKGDLLDSRLLNYKDERVFSDAMFLHPKEVNRWILDEVEALRPRGKDAFASFMFDLAYKKLKRDRYKHIDAIEVYRSES